MVFRRDILVRLHRWVGLAIAVFLVVAALTGSFLAFYEPLDAALNPHLLRVTPPGADAPRLDPFTLRERASAHLGVELESVDLTAEPGHAASFWVDAPAPADDEFFFDPYTGEFLGSRRWGDLGQGLTNLLPFLYKLHYSLALGDTGILLLGIAALLWTIDCFVGAWLTFPVSAGREGWLPRWGRAWLLRGGSRFRLVFSFHRAAGLWLWAMLFVFAWSAVGLNLKPVYHPVMKTLFGYADVWDTLPTLPAPRPAGLDWRTAYEKAKAAMAAEAGRHGFQVQAERWFSYRPGNGLFRYTVRSTRDISERFAATDVWINGQTGALVATRLPIGENAGNTITTWINALHFAAVGGTAYRVVVAVLGVLISGLVISGVLIWWRKRRARHAVEE